MPFRAYPTDLTDERRTILTPFIPPTPKNGRPRQADTREAMNAVLYLWRTGCPWRNLPHDLPPYRTVFYYFTKWRNSGVWKRIHDKLQEGASESEQRKAAPRAGIVDSQSVKTAEKEGLSAVTTLVRRLRELSATLFVDTLGLMIDVIVHGASVQDRVQPT